MPFYRKQLTYDEIAPYAQKLLLWLRQNCPVAQEYIEELHTTEVFFVTGEEFRTIMDKFGNVWIALQARKWASFIPYSTDRQVGIICIHKGIEGPQQTVSPTHIRLPKLSHLLTLTAEDFFTLMRLVDTAKNTQTGNSLMLNPAAAGCQNFPASAISPFFTKLRVNYRMNEDYCDTKWTPRIRVKFIAGLEPTRDNQLCAMQFLTAWQNGDLMYFPVESVIALELDWQQISDDYCIPPEGGTLL